MKKISKQLSRLSGVGERLLMPPCTGCIIHFSTSGCIIVNVEYRLSPEHKFPAFIDDGLVALKWTLDNKQLIGKII